MTETPRTETEISCPVCRAYTGHYDLRGPLSDVLAERERMLDLLESLRRVSGFTESQALLREHSRLLKEGQA